MLTTDFRQESIIATTHTEALSEGKYMIPDTLATSGGRYEEIER